VEYNNANQGIMPQSHKIWIQHTGRDFDNTFQGQVDSCLVLYFSRTLLNQILGFLQHLPGRKMILTILKRCKKTHQCLLHSQVQEYAVVVSTKYNNPPGWPDCIDAFIWVVEQTDKMHIDPDGAIARLEHLV
jgi:hypothetical protein